MTTSKRVKILITFLVVSACFALYIAYLYHQLDSMFVKQTEFVPTRIFSDVAKVSPPESRKNVEDRLKALGYTFSNTSEQIDIHLHPGNYPAYLLPTNHPTLDLYQKPISLKFDGTKDSSSLVAIEANGKEISEIFLEPELVATLARNAKEIREIISFEQFPALLWKAIIAVEDQHFMEHKGLDPRGLLRAIWVNVRTRSFSQGGSTLTQQLVKNLLERHSRNIIKKFNELFLALLLEIKYEKEEILERYLNEVFLGQVGGLEVHGVAEGAKLFFGKPVQELNLAECALLAGLIRGPAVYSPYRHHDRAIERQRVVLRRMVETKMITQAEMNRALTMPVRLAPSQTIANKAPYFTDYVRAELIRQLKDKMTEGEINVAGFRVYTTLDYRMNQAAQQAVGKGVADIESKMDLQSRERLEGALISVEPSTGYIRALIGGRSYAQSQFNRVFNMKRQVGSTFKPLVYLTALNQGMSPAHPVEDSPWTLKYDHGRQSWSPKNYEKEFLGWTTLRQALAHSVNTVTAKLAVQVGLENIIQTARELGVESEIPLVPSLSLGVAELSPVELLKIYCALANHGIQDELTVIRGITHDDGKGFAQFVYHPQQVFNPGSIDLLTDMLQSVFTEGTAKSSHTLGWDRPSAGKTGTTSNYRDAWFAGYTPHLTTVVWVGQDQYDTSDTVSEKTPDGKKKKKTVWRLTGGTSALPIWIDFMKSALETEPPAAFAESELVTSLRIDRNSGKQASGDCPDSQVIVEKHVKGKEPSDKTCEKNKPASDKETEIK